MRRLKTVGAAMWVGFLLAADLHAQFTATTEAFGTTASIQPDSIVQLTAEAQGLNLLPPEQVPPSGTFWVMMPDGVFSAPWPCPPFDSAFPTYTISDDIFLVDATGGEVMLNARPSGRLAATATVASALEAQATEVVNLISHVQEAEFNREFAMAFGMEPPGFEEGGTNYYFDSYTSIEDYGTNLWIAQEHVTNGYLAGIGSNTLSDIQYEIQSRTNLAQTDWRSEGFILGSETTNWTALSVAQGGRTNLFIRLRSWADDGSGLPLWWQAQYGQTDPYGDPDGDGWNNLQEFQNGTNPNSFNTPPAPRGLGVSLNSGNGHTTLRWLPLPGPVTNYLVTKLDWQTGLTNIFNVSPTNKDFFDDLSGDVLSSPLDDGPELHVNYTVTAQYAGGNSAAGNVLLGYQSPPSVRAVRGSQGDLNLVVSGLPDDITGIKVYRAKPHYIGSFDLGAEIYHAAYDYLYGSDYFDSFVSDPLTNGYFEISSIGITNGVYPVPTNQASPFGSYHFWVQGVRANNTNTEWSSDNINDWVAYNGPFIDGRQQLKDNLRFLLRAANKKSPFQFLDVIDNDFDSFFKWPTNYVYASLFHSGSVTAYGGGSADDYLYFDETRPIVENYQLRNFVYDPNFIGQGGYLSTGVYYYYDGFFYNGSQQVNLNITNNPVITFNAGSVLGTYTPTIPSSLLTPLQSQWIAPLDNAHANYPATNNARNLYGLSYLSVNTVIFTNNQVYSTVHTPVSQVTNGFPYYETAQPEFQTAGYYFARPYIDRLPEQSGFATTNTTPLIIQVVGSSQQLAGYAKLAVTNGYSGVYGYLGQYFDKAYKMDTNGLATASTTGVLSPYGEFLATEPGPMALVTMPDVDTGVRGTCAVYSVSVVIDRNQGSNMDLRFSGANTTAANNPAQIWVNDNYDRGHTVDGSDFEQDDLGPVDIFKGHLLPDCQYTNGLPAIPCTRDLEDYFRLWTPGLAAAMKVMPTNYTVQLVLSGEGQIRIFRAVESNGGTNYLFDETTASNQVANSASLYTGLLTAGSPITLPVQTNFNEHFIICGAQAGNAQIYLEILDGDQNVVAYSVAYLEINDIKQMYERWTVGENPNVAPATIATNEVDNLSFKYQPPPNTNTPYILFVHGWNMEAWEKDRFAEAAYKRLYWQGYQGRFGIFRWPTGNKFAGTWADIATDSRNYDNSEFTAWRSATGLTNLLTQLNTEYPGNVYLMAHSMGNVVVGEALRKANTQLVNTYVAMQGAVPAHAYDATATTRAIVAVGGLGGDDGTPNRYANYYTNSAPCYFNASAGAGTYVNFYNTNDYALGKWTIDQNFKPDNGIPYPGYHYSSSSGFYRINGSITTYLNFSADTYEIFAYGDEARCYALGAQEGVNGVFDGNQIDLQTVWPTDTHLQPSGLYSGHVWHSGQFRDDYPHQANFWNSVLSGVGFNLK